MNSSATVSTCVSAIFRALPSAASMVPLEQTSLDDTLAAFEKALPDANVTAEVEPEE